MPACANKPGANDSASGVTTADVPVRRRNTSTPIRRSTQTPLATASPAASGRPSPSAAAVERDGFPKSRRSTENVAATTRAPTTNPAWPRSLPRVTADHWNTAKTMHNPRRSRIHCDDVRMCTERDDACDLKPLWGSRRRGSTWPLLVRPNRESRNDRCSGRKWPSSGLAPPAGENRTWRKGHGRLSSPEETRGGLAVLDGRAPRA